MGVGITDEDLSQVEGGESGVASGFGCMGCEVDAALDGFGRVVDHAAVGFEHTSEVFELVVVVPDRLVGVLTVGEHRGFGGEKGVNAVLGLFETLADLFDGGEEPFTIVGAACSGETRGAFGFGKDAGTALAEDEAEEFRFVEAERGATVLIGVKLALPKVEFATGD